MQVTIDLPDDLARRLEPDRGNLVEVIRRGLRPPAGGGLSVAEEMFAFLASRPSPEEIVGFRPSENAATRLRELLDGSRNNALTADEQAELDTLEALDDLFALVKIRARQQTRTTA